MSDVLRILVDSHPKLEAVAFSCRYRAPLAQLPPDPAIATALRADADMPFRTDHEVKAAVRNLLRVGGFRPSGRSKPSSEYLAKAALQGSMHSINAAVDACNAASLHSGLPISVVDLDLARGPFRIRVADEGTQYVFNPSGQVIDVAGLICLFDVGGPCANAVKDAQRTKTHPDTTRTLSIVWGTVDLAGRAASVAAWYHQALELAGHSCGLVDLEATPS